MTYRRQIRDRQRDVKMHRIICALMLSLALPGCEKKPPPSPAETSSQTAQTASPLAAAAHGDPHAALNNTLTMVVQSLRFETTEIGPLQDYLSSKIGKPVVVQLVPTEDQVIEQLHSGAAQMSFTPSWTFMIAHQRADMEVVAVTTVDDSAFVDSLWLVAKKSKIKSTKDLKGKKVGFTTASSAEGFLLPLSQLMKDGVLSRHDDPEAVFKSVGFAGSDQAALAGLLDGKYEAVAVSADALDDSSRAKVAVLKKQGPVPREAFSAKSTLDDEVKAKISAALLDLAKPENAALKSSVIGDVGLVKEAHYEYTQAIQDAIDTVDADYPL